MQIVSWNGFYCPTSISLKISKNRDLLKFVWHKMCSPKRKYRPPITNTFICFIACCVFRL